MCAACRAFTGGVEPTEEQVTETVTETLVSLDTAAARARLTALTLRTAIADHPTLGADLVVLLDSLEKDAQRAIELARGLVSAMASR